MIKLITYLFLLTFCVAFSLASLKEEFDESLKNIVRRRVIPPSRPKKSQQSRPGMRSTSDHAKYVHDLFEFQSQFISKNGISKRSLPVGFTINSTYCPYVAKTCDSTYKYRSNDGSCNNLANPLYGSSNIPYKRLLAPAYADSFNSPRTKAVSGNPLPNPRTLSLSLSPPISGQKLTQNTTHLFPLFGQFLTHDIAGASTTTDEYGNEIECLCTTSDKNCMAIAVPSNDSFLSQSCTNAPSPTGCITNAISSQNCINFTRSSATFPDFSCQASYREQLNLLSSYIDGSAIYGLDSVRANALRAFTGGLLKTSSGIAASLSTGITSRSYLPLASDACTSSSNPTYNCFLGGEWRTSENLGLVGMQTLFNREHNRIAVQLAKLNPSWNDETVYQETRRIVIAQLQHIVYNEFLPLISGDTSLAPLKTNSYYTGYDSTINPSLYNEFTTAAFRFGHSLIRQASGRFDINNNQLRGGNYNFQSIVFQSDFAYSTQYQGLNSIVNSLFNELAWKFGTFGNQLQNNLFQMIKDGSKISTDLLALNINRGRDHGLKSYVSYVQKCFNTTITSFTDLSRSRLMPPNKVQVLQSFYESVNDIDLYAGGLSESTTSDLYNVGPTFGCIIMQQFKELKNGDRFYYENGPSSSSTAFTLNQLAAIKNVTIAGLICNNYDITSIQPSPFMSSSQPGNSNVNCATLMNQINLNNWQN